MAEHKSIELPNPDDIITLLDASIETIKSVSSAVSKISSVKVEDIVQSSKNMKKLESGIINFIDSMVTIVREMAASDIINGNEDYLRTLLIDANEYKKNKDGSFALDENQKKIIVKQGFTLPTLIATVGSSISNMNKTMSDIANIGLDLGASVKFRISILLFKSQLKDILSTIKSMLDDPKLEQTLFNSETNLKGTVTVFEQLNELINVIGEYASAKNLICVITAKKITRELYRKKLIGKGSKGLLSQINDMIRSDAWKELKNKNTQKSIGEVKKTINSLVNIVQSINELAITLIDIRKNWLKSVLGLFAAKKLINQVVSLVAYINGQESEVEENGEKKKVNKLVINSDEAIENIQLMVSILEDFVSIEKNASILAVFAIPAIIGLVLARGVIWAIQLLIKGINKYSFDIQKTGVDKSIAKLVAIMSHVAILVLVTALTGMLVIKYAFEIFQGFIAIYAMTWATLFILYILSKEQFQSMSVEAALSLMLISSTLIIMDFVIILAAATAALMMKFSDLIGPGLLVLIASIGLLALLFWITSLGISIYLAGAIAFAVLAGTILIMEIAVLLLVGVINVLSKVEEQTVVDALWNLKIMLLGDDRTGAPGVIIVLAGCAKYILEILEALVVMTLLTVLSVMLLVITAIFIGNAKMLGKLGPDGIAEARDNIDNMLNSFIDAIDIFSGRGVGGSAKLMLKISGALIVFTQLMIIAGCISAMAAVIQHFAALDMKEYDENGHPTGGKIKMTPDDIMTAADNIRLISSFFVLMMEKGSHAVGNVNFAGLDLDKLEKVNSSNTAKFMELMTIVTSIGLMAKTVSMVAAMNIPTDFDSEGNPLGYRQMKRKDFTDATQNIADIALVFIQALKQPLVEVDDFSRSQANKLKTLLSIGDHVSSMVDTVIKINEKSQDLDTTTTGAVLMDVVSMVINNGLQYKDSSGAMKNIKDVSSQVEKNWKSVRKSSTILGQIIDDFNIKKINVEDHKKFIDENIKFIDKANSIDVDKIKTVSDMFVQMTEFSKSLNGNIEDLAKVLSEDLVDALNELNGVMKGTSDTVEKSTAVGTSMKQDSKTPAPTPTATNNSQTSQKVDLSGVESKLQDIVTKLSKINTNIEDLQ